MKWHSTTHTGVRYRKKGKDRYFVIRYKLAGRLKEEAIGWASDGWTAEKASLERAKLREAHRTGKGAQTLAEKRQIAEEEKEREEKRKEEQARNIIPFGAFFTKTYLPQAKVNKAQKSWKTEDQLFRCWISPTLSKVYLKEVTPAHIEKIKAKMQKAKKAPRTIQYTYAVVRQVFNIARMLGAFEGENPTKKVAWPKIDNNRVRFLTESEAEQLLEALAEISTQLYEIALISLYCGLRAGEIFALVWDRIDLEREHIHVRDAKGGTRVAFMPKRVKAMLEAKQEKSGLVFWQRKKGKKQKINGVSKAFSKTVKELGFNEGVTDDRDKVVFHTLRHTFASWLVERGTDLYRVQKLMGHSTSKMTERYAHFGENSLKSAIEKLDA